MNQIKKPRNYEEWLALDDEQREAVLYSWNPYRREAIGFPYIAAGRLAIASEVRVLDVGVGTYHGGEYVLHIYVDDAAIPTLPKLFQQRFEGFRVAWLPVSQLSQPKER